MKKSLLALLFSASLFALEIGSTIPDLMISDDNGAKVTGEPFDTQSMRGKTSLIFYVDPDEKSLNEHVGKAIKEAKFDRSHFQSYAIINMEATWLPNFAIETILEDKQKEYPNTIYVKDLKKNFVYMWQIADDNSDVILLDANGKVLFIHEGKLPPEKLQELIKLIQTHT